VWGGGQAERIRVPFADHLCEKVPAELTDDDALFLGDILSTGYVCAENGGIRPGDTVAVFGAGPVGLLCMQSAQLFGPARVFAVDRVDYRLALAAEFGAEPVNLDAGDPAEQLRRLTGGHGPDVVLECVGHETPFTQAIQSVRAGGTVSSVGVYVETSMGFPAREAFFKDLTLKMGICNARNYMTPLMPLVQRKKLQPARIVTHTMALKDAPRGYAIFDQKQDRAIKVMLKP
jgi:threonine dehydrogenase-like Zn-dependent dehydrogenase